MTVEPKKAPFSAFEGIDKCGKKTQSLLAADFLRSSWGGVEHFSEPNDRDSLVGRRIRRILRHKDEVPSIEDFQRLYVFDRAQNTVCKVLPALAHGVPVVAERFALSTIAYGSLTGETELYVRMHKEVLGAWLRWPDLTIILDIPAEMAMERLARERGKPELFEKLESLIKVRETYLKLAQSSRTWAPNMEVVVLDATGSIVEVAAKIQAVLTPYLR